MSDTSVNSHAQVWAQAFNSSPDTVIVPRTGLATAEQGQPVTSTEPTDAAPFVAPPLPAPAVHDAFPPMPGSEEATAAAETAVAEYDDSSEFDDLFDALTAAEDLPATEPRETEPDAAAAPAPTLVLPPPTEFVPTAGPSLAPALPERPVASHATAGGVSAAANTRYEKRYQQAAMLQPFVNHLRAFIPTVPSLNELVRSFVLTSDWEQDQVQQRQLANALSTHLGRADVHVTSKLPPVANMATVLEMLYDDAIGIGPLGPLWRDPDVTEIIVRGPDTVLVERVGQTLVPDIATFRDLEHLQSTARELATTVSGRALSPTNPLVTAELPGARVQFVYTPLTRDGVFIAIRKFRPLLNMQALIDNHSLTPDMAQCLSDLVRARATIVVSGGTGSGKTSLVNALSEFIDPTEHVVTIEDSYELKLDHSNVTALQTKERASADDQLIVPQADLLVAALRMRPDRIIVGEIREGRGADTMMRAAGTGHDGSMTTIHANDPTSAVSERLPDLLMEHKRIPMDTARRSVANAIDVVVHVSKRAGRRYVSAISVLDPSMVTDVELSPHPLFTYNGYDAQLVGRVDIATELGIRMVEAGIGQKWRSDQ